MHVRRMQVRRPKNGQGVRAEVLQRLGMLEQQVEFLKRELCALTMRDQIDSMANRVAALEAVASDKAA